MIQEDYVNFEVAKLLKDKGFNQDYYNYPVYWMNGQKPTLSFEGDDDFPYSQNECVAPTLASVMKWLREVHHYYIQVMLDSWACNGHSGYYVILQRTDNNFEMMLQDAVDEVFYQTYEEAASAAVKYCLTNLI